MTFNTAKPVDRYEITTTALHNFIDHQLECNKINATFPSDVQQLSDEGTSTDPARYRSDLRELPCMTIDCDDTKDMDDACGLKRTAEGYRLWVHIADVSSYVLPGSLLDQVALERGTSLYLPDRTIPMLPAVLSDDLCSLKPGVDRRAISVEIDLDSAGKVKSYTICRSLIRSLLKGTYSEVNDLLGGSAGRFDAKKYRPVENMLRGMAELASKLRARRINEGACVEKVEKPKFKIESGRLVLVRPHMGEAEAIVEEFMVLCNKLVAEYLIERGLPALFRTQRKSGEYASYTITAEPHANLNLESYTHFTSPIRRLCDLKVHQSLAMYLDGVDTRRIWERMGDLWEESQVATRRSRRADSLGKACFNRCVSLYFEADPNAVYKGMPIGADVFGNERLMVSGLSLIVSTPRNFSLFHSMRYSFMVRTVGPKRRAQAYDIHPCYA